MFVAAMLALTSSVLYFYRSSNYALQQSSAISSAQRGIDNLVKSIRAASYASNGSYPIVSVGAHDIRFYEDDDTDAAIEQVHYYVSGSALYKGVVDLSGDPAVYGSVEATSTISDNVRNLDATVGTTTFTYYDDTGAQITNYANTGKVRFVTVTLEVDVDPSKSPTPLVLRSSAALRNLIGH